MRATAPVVPVVLEEVAMQTLSLSAYSSPPPAATPAPLGATGDPRAGGEPDAPFGVVTAQRLIALGIVANALFWSGMLIPFNVNMAHEIAFLHAFVSMLGLALALGGAVAAVMLVAHQISVRLFSAELTAGVLHFTVVAAFATLSFSAFLRGWSL